MLHTTAFEVNLTEHCNLKCANCNHASHQLAEKFTPLEVFKSDIGELSKVMTVDEIKLLGGEPLLHPQLLDFLRAAKASGIAKRVCIVTNGVLLPKMPVEFWELVDRIWVSVYPGIKYSVDLKVFEDQAKQHGVEIWIKKSNSFTLGMLNQKNEDAELVQQIYTRCRYAHLSSCHTVLEGYYYKCSTTPFIEPKLALQGVEFKNRKTDGVAIHDNPNLKEDLENYLRDPKPLSGCHYCLGSVGKLTPNVQLSKSKRAAELLADHTNVRDLIDWEAYENPWDPKQLDDPPPWVAEYKEIKAKILEGKNALIK